MNWKDVLAKYGVAGAIALGLTYTLAVTINTNTREARDSAVEAKALMVQHISAMEPMNAQLRSLVNIQLQTCANQADDVVKRSRCFESVYSTPTR